MLSDVRDASAFVDDMRRRAAEVVVEQAGSVWFASVAAASLADVLNELVSVNGRLAEATERWEAARAAVEDATRAHKQAMAAVVTADTVADEARAREAALPLRHQLNEWESELRTASNALADLRERQKRLYDLREALSSIRAGDVSALRAVRDALR